MTQPAPSSAHSSREQRSRQVQDLWRRRASVRYGAGLALFTLVTLLWLAPLIPRLGSSVLNGESDQTNAIAEYSAMQYQHQNPFTFNRNTLNGAPEGFPDPAAERIAQPIQSAFVWAAKFAVGITAALNLFVVLGFILTAATAFAFLDWLGCSPLSSVFGAYVIAFNPWMFNSAIAGADAFLHGWSFIILLWAFVHLERSRSLRAAALFGAAFGLTFWVAAYFGLLAALIVLVSYLVVLVRASDWADRLWVATLACTTLAVTGLFLLPGFVAYVTDHATVAKALDNSVVELQIGAASLASYAFPSYRHPVFGAITRHFLTYDQSERTLFFGYTTIALAALTIWRMLRSGDRAPGGRQRAITIAAAILIPLAFLASLPRIAHVGPASFPTPSYFIGYLTTYFRKYVRFGYLVGIGLAILAAIAMTSFSSRRATVIRAALLACLVFELLPGSISAWAHAGPRPYDRWLLAQPQGIVANYPMPTDQRAALTLAGSEFYYQRFNHHPLFTIFGTGFALTRVGAIRLLVRYVTDPVTPGVLAAEDVRYVVIHDDVFRAEGETPPVLSAPTFVPVARFGTVRVFRLHAAPADVNAALAANQAALGLVEGLSTPTPTFGAGFSPAHGGQELPRASAAQSVVVVDNTGDGVTFQFLIAASARRPGTLTVSTGGSVIGTLALQPAGSSLSGNAVTLPPGRSSITLSATEPFTLSRFQPQPLADITTSP